MTEKHTKIRFSKGRIKKLHQYPSAVTPDGMRIVAPKLLLFWFRFFRYCFTYGLLFFVFLLILFAVLLKVGISGDILVRKMEGALQNKLTHVAQTKITNASLAFDKKYHLALEAHDVALTNVKGGIAIDKIGVLRLGLASVPLLRGEIKVAQFEIENSVIKLPASNNSHFFEKLPQDSTGHIDFNSVSIALFKAFNTVFTVFQNQETNLIVIRNVTLQIDPLDAQKALYIDQLSLQYKDNLIFSSGEFTWNGQSVVVEAKIHQSVDTVADNFVLSIKNLPYHLGAEDISTREFHDGRPNNAYFRSQGLVNIGLQGSLLAENSVDLNLTLSLVNSLTDLGQDFDIATLGEFNFGYNSSDPQLILLPSQFSLGSLQLPLKGNLKPVFDVSELGVYDFNIMVDDGVVQPNDIDAPRLEFKNLISGRFMSQQAMVNISKLLIATKDSMFEGEGHIQFGVGSPKIQFWGSAPHMTLIDFKQLWPINFAPAARRWIISHVFDGNIKNAKVNINLPQGILKSNAPPPSLTEDEVKVEAQIENMSSLLVGDLPSVREILGRVTIKGTTTEIFIDNAVTYTEKANLEKKKNKIDLANGYLVIPWQPNTIVFADISVRFQGEASDVIKFASFNPINAQNQIPITTSAISGDILGEFKLRFPLLPHPDKQYIDWSTDIIFKKLSFISPLDDNVVIKQANGTVSLDKKVIKIFANAELNGMPANIELLRPVEASDAIPHEKILIELTDDIRQKLMPGLNDIIMGTIALEIGAPVNGVRPVKADVGNAEIRLPWAGWTKGKGIDAEAEFLFKTSADGYKTIEMRNFSLKGSSFIIAGNISIENGALKLAELSRVNLNRGDSLGMTIKNIDNVYHIIANGKKFDARSLIKLVTSDQNQGQTKNSTGLELVANIDNFIGFYDETLNSVKVKVIRKNSSNEEIVFNGLTSDNKTVIAKIVRTNNKRDIDVIAGNAGNILRLMDYYDKVRGGFLQLNLSAGTDGTLKGPVSVKNFQIVNEPRLHSLVTSQPHTGGKSLDQVTNGKLDVSVVNIETASAEISKGNTFLVLDNGIIRGETIGATFQGIVYDAAGIMSMTGTFMPAYGLNRVFSDVPVFGALLGNGKDRGLIGITFKIDGKAREPKVTVNPISAIAPGVFRQIFEYQQ